MNFVGEQNQRVFVFEDDLWAVKGRYESVLASNEDVNWSVLENQFILKLLIVSILSTFCSILINKNKQADDKPTQATSTPTTPGPSAQPPSYSTAIATTSLTSMKEQLATLLGVPLHLVGSGDVSLRIAYQKYKAFLAATHTAEQLVSNGTLDKKPPQGDIMALFSSKSYFHSHIKKCFSKVADHPEMVAWLEEEPGVHDVDVWGVQKEVYNFTDLKAWLSNGGPLVSDDDYEETVDKRKGKKKGKEIDKGKDKGKGKKKEMNDREGHKEKKKKKDGRRAK